MAYFYDIVRSDHKAAVCSHEQAQTIKHFISVLEVGLEG